MAKKEQVKEKVEPLTVESPLKSGMSDTTKGLIIGVAVTALIATLIILLILGENDKKETGDDFGQDYVSPNYGTSADSSEALVEFYEYFQSDEKALIVFASSQCSYCLAQEPIVHAIADKYDLNYLYMDYLNLGSDSEIGQVIEELGIEGSTPTSVVVQNGKVLTNWVGYVDGESYVEYLVDAGMLKKGTTYDFEKNITSIDYDKFKSLLKGSKMSAIIVDTPTCSVCFTERLALNELAGKHNIPVYQLSAESLTEDETDAFIEGLGGWGYTTEDYEKDQSVEVPLLLFVKNGKIIDFEVGYVEGETDLEALFEDAGIIK